MSVGPEDLLQFATARFLGVACPDLLWSHFPAGEKRAIKTARKLKDMGLKRGWPDIILCLPDGRMAGIELKAPGAYQKPEQKQFQAALAARGAPYAVCRSLDEVETTLRGWGVSLRARSPE